MTQGMRGLVSVSHQYASMKLGWVDGQGDPGGCAIILGIVTDQLYDFISY